MPILRVYAAYICGRPAERVFVAANTACEMAGAFTDAHGCVRLLVPAYSTVDLDIDGCPGDAPITMGVENHAVFARVGSPVIHLLDVSVAGAAAMVREATGGD